MINSDLIYKAIETDCQEAASKILSGHSLESFLKLDVKSQILGLKVFAYMGHDFEALKDLEQFEMMLGSLHTCD